MTFLSRKAEWELTDGEWEEGLSRWKKQHVQICEGGNIERARMKRVVKRARSGMACLGQLSRALSDLVSGPFFFSLLWWY